MANDLHILKATKKFTFPLLHISFLISCYMFRLTAIIREVKPNLPKLTATWYFIAVTTAISS